MSLRTFTIKYFQVHYTGIWWTVTYSSLQVRLWDHGRGYAGEWKIAS